MDDQFDIRHIGDQFETGGRFLQAERCGSGHINLTYLAEYAGGERTIRMVHQRINRHVFKEPQAVMENIRRVLEHQREALRRRGVTDGSRRVLELVPTRDGAWLFTDDSGEVWRTYRYVERARTYNTVERLEQAEQAARAFGLFQSLVSDLPPPRLHDTIPDFHHTPKRFAALLETIDRDPLNRCATARAVIDAAVRAEEVVHALETPAAEGRLPCRIAHNDTKLNNVMMDIRTGEGICVIDLDTVMPGLALYDFGDLTRSMISAAPEDEVDLDRIEVRPEVYEAIVRGYLSTAGDMLSPAEIDLLAVAGQVITLETGLRFLKDYLEGDRYFRVQRPSHNLDRARAQLCLAESIGRHRAELDAITRRLCRV